MTEVLADPQERVGVRMSRLAPAVGVSLSAFVLFGLRLTLPGLAILFVSLLAAILIDRFELGRGPNEDSGFGLDLSLIGLGIAIVSTTSVEADVEWPSFVRIGTVLGLAVLAPYLIDRLVLSRHGLRRRVIRFPWRSHEKKTRLEIAYVFIVPLLGYLLLPFYFIRSGAYENWPHITDLSELLRFFVGVNAVGTFDELFFICTCLVLFRRHFPFWLANLLQMVIFVSFLWELGYRAWAPIFTIPFALLQGYLFAKTRSLGYVLAVHLLFDALVFLAIVHAHNRDWIPVFLY